MDQPSLPRQSTLFRYRHIDENFIERTSRIFTHNELYFPQASDFNDPFDCQCAYSFAADPQKQRRWLRQLAGQRFPNWNRKDKDAWIAKTAALGRMRTEQFEAEIAAGQNRVIATVGICSLTRVPDDILMWSHYANAHRGFCLVFDERDPFFARAFEVAYSDTYPVINPVLDDYEVRLNKALLTKSLHWSYEHEWRIIEHESGPGIKRFPPHSLCGVIFGCRMSDRHKSQISGWCRARMRQVQFFRAREAERTYSLDIVGL
jgi:hypothetical protein